MDRLPSARGPLTDTLLAHLVGDDDIHAVTVEVDPRTDDDLHLALYLCYQLHYGGLAGVPDGLGGDPVLVGVRGVLEAAFEDALLAEVEVRPAHDTRPMVDQLRDIVRSDPSTGVSGHLQREATR